MKLHTLFFTTSVFVSLTLAQSNGALQQVYQEALPATVRIENNGVGTGFFFTRDGYVLTAYHVVQGSQRLRVTLSDRSQLNASLVGFDEYRDLAVIRVASSRSNFPTLSFANATPSRTEALLAIGNSKGSFLAARNGNLRALNQELAPGFPQGLISMNLRLAPGDSGGPVLNRKGQVVGVAVAVGRDQNGFQSYASPVFSSNQLIAGLQSGNRRSAPFLGVQLLELTPQTVREIGYGRVGGLLIERVIPGTGAAKAGLRNARLERSQTRTRILEADILVAVDGQEFTSRGELVEYLRSRTVGGQVELRIQRGNQLLTVPATLGTRP